MSHPDINDNVLTRFKWQSISDTHTEREDLLLKVFAEQCFASGRSSTRDEKDYLLTLIASASDPHVDADSQTGFDSARMHHVITEAAAKSDWGKPSGPGRAQGIAAHYDSPACIAVVLDVEVSEEGYLTIHEATVVADLGTVANPGRTRSQLEGACLMGVAFVTSSHFGATTGNPCPGDNTRSDWPAASVGPKQIAVHLITSSRNLDASQTSPVGKVSYAPVVRALCNGIFNATGHRTRNLPFRSQLLERVGSR